jgi:hypothetical protein
MLAAITDVLDRLQREHTRLGITLNPPATEIEIAIFEQQKGVQLPADVRAFYLCCNGFDVDNDLFRFIPLAENLEGGWHHLLLSPRDLFIAEYMIYADAWALAIDASASTGYFVYNAREELTLTTSFTEFLEAAIHQGVHSSGGLYDWESRLRLPASPSSALPTPMVVTTLSAPHKPWYKFW